MANTSKLASVLLRNRKSLLEKAKKEGTNFWSFMDDLGGKQATKKIANKFLLCCIIDLRQQANMAWVKGIHFVEETLFDPKDLWEVITSYSEKQWMSKQKKFDLHFYGWAHKRVWRIGHDVMEEYQGDARNIWRQQGVGEIRRRLEAMRVGPVISSMVIGALRDTGQIASRNPSDAKLDTHVCRVIGRITMGRKATPRAGNDMLRQLYPKNPWMLDRPLFCLGQACCHSRTPNCEKCIPGLRKLCKYYSDHRA